MNDGLPSDEQLGRIERGVMARIDRRRRIGHRVAGTAAALAIAGGGFALIGPLVGTSGTSSGGSAASGAGSSAGDSVAATVLCHAGPGRDSATRKADVDPAALPGAAAEACARVEFQSGSGRVPTAASPGAVEGQEVAAVAVCRATDDVLHVYPLGASSSAAARCAANGMTAATP